MIKKLWKKIIVIGCFVLTGLLSLFFIILNTTIKSKKVKAVSKKIKDKIKNNKELISKIEKEKESDKKNNNNTINTLNDIASGNLQRPSK